MGRALIVLAALLVIVPAAVAQTTPTTPGIYNPNTSTETTLYPHINGFQDFPINTQKPNDAYARAVIIGLQTHSACVVDPAGAQHFTDRSYHTWYGYSSPSYVQYDVDNDGEPRIHQERGLSYDIIFDKGVAPVFTWYLEARGPVEGGQGMPPPIPNVVVRATVREGDDISVGNSAFNQGLPVAIGQTAPWTLAGPLTQEDPSGQVSVQTDEDGNYIYGFSVPLEFKKDKIDKKQSYNIRVDAFMDNPRCADPGADGGDYIMANFALVHTSSTYRPNLKWNIMNPLMIEALHPQFVGDQLAIHTASNSPYGSYDVLGDLKSETPMILEIDGPSTAVSLDQVALVDHSLGHGPEEHFKAVAATWLWDYQADAAVDGTYTVVLRIKNDQQTADAVAVATFTIGDGTAVICGRNLGETEDTCIEPEDANKAGEEAPGVGLTTLVGLIGAAAVVARRRF